MTILWSGPDGEDHREVASKSAPSSVLSVDPTGNLGQSVSALREAFRVEHGERMLIWCEGGPSIGRAVAYPPPLEIEVADGIYVLVDDGPPENWHYVFIKTDSRR